MAALTVLSAYGAVMGRGYDADVTKGKRPGTGARLIFSAGFAPEKPMELILTPEVRDFWIDQTGKAGLLATCQDHAQLQIVHGQTQTGVTLADIGTYGMISLGDAWVQGVGAWSFPLPVGSAGPMMLAQENRTSPPRDLLRWTPVFRVTGTGPHNLTFSVEFRMHVRAIPGPRWRSGLVGATVWGQPTDQFDAKFDGGASVVTWSVSGGEVDPSGSTQYSYSGGGTQGLSFVDAQGGLYRATFHSSDGQTAVADFENSATLPYTETITDLGSGQATTTEHLLPIAGLTLNNLALSPNWAIQAGSEPLALSSTFTGTVSWAAAAPTPLFDSAHMRR
jgi:hypothetical protein